MKSINDGSEYVFASQRDKTGHVSEFGNVIDRIRKVTMLNDFRLHDLRHIVATKMIDLDVPFIHVGKVLNHKGLSAKNAITSRYVNTNEKKELEQKNKALNIWTGHLTELTTNLSLQKHG
jgi:integrase